jgi:hypothetical protein
VRQCAVVTDSQIVLHGVRRYWTRGIAVVQHVSGAGADCCVRGMSVVKVLTLLDTAVRSDGNAQWSKLWLRWTCVIPEIQAVTLIDTRYITGFQTFLIKLPRVGRCTSNLR